ncbi:MAG: hypothetical protein M3Q98_13425 [Actinomycetota bacterium]|nr:hypothetical protein [Actinomycetota bacterium]
MARRGLGIVTAAADRLGLTLDLVMPQSLPSHPTQWSAAVAALPSEVGAARTALGQDPEQTPHLYRRDLCERAAATLAQLGRPHDRPTLAPDGAWDNDRAFGIARVEGGDPALVLGPVFTTLARLYADVLDGGSSLSREDWTDLERVMACCVSFPLLDQSAWTRGAFSHPGVARTVDAERRWVIGHHLFMIISEFLIIAGNFLEAASADGDRAMEAKAISAITTLLRGASAAFRYACDFGTDDYNEVIRPSLSPPIAPEGMSGMNWRDHVHLMATFRRLRNHFPDHGDGLDRERSELRAAYERMYVSHTHVCKHFVGSEESSLSLSAKTRSAVDALDRLRQGRSAFHGITTTN